MPRFVATLTVDVEFGPEPSPEPTRIFDPSALPAPVPADMALRYAALLSDALRAAADQLRPAAVRRLDVQAVTVQEAP